MRRSGRSEHRLPPLMGVSTRTDPHFRRSDVSAIKRRRMRGRYWRLARWVVPSVVGAVVLMYGAKGLVASGLLRVREITIVGNDRLSPGDVRTLVAGLEREQIFHVDLEHYRARLLDSPWVADVRLTRLLPARIQIVVTERVPIGAARHGQQLYLVDKTGSIIGDYGPATADRSLPVIDGLIVSDRKLGPQAVPARARLAAALFEDLDARLADTVSEVDVSNPHDAVVLLDEDPAWLHVGDRAFGERLERYLATREALVERFGRLDYVDLRFGERLFLRGLDSAAQTPVAARSVTR